MQISSGKMRPKANGSGPQSCEKKPAPELRFMVENQGKTGIEKTACKVAVLGSGGSVFEFWAGMTRMSPDLTSKWSESNGLAPKDCI